MAWWGHSVSKGEWIYTHLVDIKLLTLRPLLFGTQMSGTQGSLNGPGGRQPGTLTSKPLNQPWDCRRVPGGPCKRSCSAELSFQRARYLVSRLDVEDVQKKNEVEGGGGWDHGQGLASASSIMEAMEEFEDVTCVWKAWLWLQ